MIKIAVLLDFDGTITTINVLDSLYEKFAGPSFRTHMERWQRSEISTMEEIEQVFKIVKATRQEMETFLLTVQLDPGFISLLFFCRERGYPFAIVSDGLRWYIDYVLDIYSVCVSAVYASEIEFVDGGFRFDYPWFDPAYPMRSTAKPVIVKDYQRRGYKVVFVGDGLSDVEAAGVADIVYAKDILLQEMRARGISVKEFQDLHDIYKDL
jgi:2,3-diketo-5-methylthio-1-phosphopentane phosphatase